MENAIIKLNQKVVQGWENSILELNHTGVQGCANVVHMYEHTDLPTATYTKLWGRHVDGYHIICRIIRSNNNMLPVWTNDMDDT